MKTYEEIITATFSEAVKRADAEMYQAIEAWFEYWDDRYDGEPLRDYEIKMLNILRKAGRNV